MYYSGIDLHSDNCFITTVDEQGTVVKQQRIENVAEFVLDYFHSLGDSHTAVVESTTGWYWLNDLLEANGIELVLAHAKYLKAISYAKVKTDKVDSHTLATLLRLNLIPRAHKSSHELRDLRDTMRARLRLVHKRTACSLSLHTIGVNSTIQRLCLNHTSSRSLYLKNKSRCSPGIFLHWRNRSIRPSFPMTTSSTSCMSQESASSRPLRSISKSTASTVFPPTNILSPTAASFLLPTTPTVVCTIVPAKMGTSISRSPSPILPCMPFSIIRSSVLSTRRCCADQTLRLLVPLSPKNWRESFTTS